MGDYKSLRVAVEDTIMQKGKLATAGSKILENFIAPFDATVVTRLKAAGVPLIGKTKTDEFGAAGLVIDTHVEDVVTAVADGIAQAALCNDYTGAVRRQAVQAGLCYVSPTYGTVSRYGLIPAVSSMDQIGIVCKTPAEGFSLLSLIAGYDPNDGAMFPEKVYSYEPGRSGIKIGVPENVPQTAAVLEFIKNFETVQFELKHFDAYDNVMKILCFAELSNNISRYDGIKFGRRAEGVHDLNELYTKSRTEAFGLYAKLSAIMGAVVLSHGNYERYFDKAMRVRRIIKESLDFGRGKYDAIVLPESAAGTVLAQLAGLPSVTVPFGDGGVTLVADVRCENILFSAMEAAL